MKPFFQMLTLTGLVCVISGSAMAVVAAPGPEIGEGMLGATVAMVAALAFVVLPRLRRMRQSKE
jgi:Family of unknown function (DUF6223)